MNIDAIMYDVFGTSGAKPEDLSDVELVNEVALLSRSGTRLSRLCDLLAEQEDRASRVIPFPTLP